jgi:predicted ATPase/DNA-binding CsgD family transcriptional regulator
MEHKGIALSSQRTAGFEQTSIRHLPISLTPLVGREREVAAICALLSRPEVRLVTLTGTGGVGKTRLALEVAAAADSNFADGIYFVALAPLTDPELVVSTIAQALGVREHGSRPLLDSLKDHLFDKQLLLLLDNFEQIISAAPVIIELLSSVPRLKVLVTSRASLHLSGEHEFVAPPLSLPDLRDLPLLERLIEYESVRLFIERAQAVHSDFAMTEENGAAIAAICQQVDGLPLAIELAAGRSKLFSPQELLPRLKSRLKLLVGGARDLPVRQQTLRGTIAWSHDLLEEDEKRLFRRLAVFVGGCTLEAIEAICTAHEGLDEDVFDAVARLVDKSLLRQEARFDGEPRLWMLETIREYALERLEASEEAEVVQRQHAIFFLRLSEEAEPKIRSAEQSTWRKRLEVEQDNLRAALRWTLESQEAEMGLRLAGALLAFWRVSNLDREGRNWCEQVLAQPGARARTAARAKALLAAGIMTVFKGDLVEANRLLEESIAIGWEGGAAGKRNLARALATLAHVAVLQGHLDAARELAGESLQVFREMGEAWGMALALNHLGRATVELGDPVAARALLEESAALFCVAGDRQNLAQPLNALGLAALRHGDYVGARTYFEEALSVAQETAAEQYRADALAHLGTVALRVGDFQQSASLYQQSLALNRVLGNQEGIAGDLAGLAEVASLLGQPKRAARLFGAVEALREVSGISLSTLRRAAYDRAVEGIHAQLDEATFVAAWKEGHVMPLDQAIAFAGETKVTLPTDAKLREAKQEETSSDLPPGDLSSPPLSPRRAMKQHFGGLTAREREVARLVAQGKSNRAIAEELVVGISTVEAHITHILSKLGFSSRAQIAAWAVDKGLVQFSQVMEDNGQEH